MRRFLPKGRGNDVDRLGVVLPILWCFVAVDHAFSSFNSLPSSASRHLKMRPKDMGPWRPMRVGMLAADAASSKDSEKESAELSPDLRLIKSGGRGCLGEGRLGAPGLGGQIFAVFSFIS